MMTGRRHPYTKIGLGRLKCVRCGEPATNQWKACSDGLWRPVCRKCDILMNRILLMFLFPDDPDGNDKKINQYIEGK